MRKILSIIVLLAISSTLSFGQKLTVKPSIVSSDQENGNQNLVQYFNKNVVSNSKTSIWSSTMGVASQWVATKFSSQSANITNTWTWCNDTVSMSNKFKQYVHPDLYMKSPTCANGLFYFDGITNLTSTPAIYGAYNSALTNAVAINTTGYNAVSIKFYQLYKSYNSDTSFLEISNDSVNWKSIDVNPNVAVNVYAYGWKEFNISPWAANKANVWIRFRFAAPEFSGTPPQQGFGGGYGWALDDVELIEPANNNIQVDRVTLHGGYTEIPSGLGLPLYFDADITNIGALAQSHVKLHGVSLSTGADSVSMDTTLLPLKSISYLNTTTSFFMWNTDYFETPSTTVGTYKVTSYISSDSILKMALDTFSYKVVCDTCKYSRDNNTYTNSVWYGATGTTSDAYSTVNSFEVNQSKMAYGVNFVVSKDTKVGSRVKAVLYKWDTETSARVVVAQSTNYYITADKIPASSPMVNPPSISLPFSSNGVLTGYTMEPDSSYWLGVQVYGGSDTVKIATDNTGIPQFETASLVVDPSTNVWYRWSSGNTFALMIRTVFNQYEHWNGVGINEINNTVSLFSCMPNPANNVTKISYELKNNEKVSIIITDITGRTVKTINQATQAKGTYSVDVDLSNLTSGTYFYTLKTATAQATDKLIIVKR